MQTLCKHSSPIRYKDCLVTCEQNSNPALFVKAHRGNNLCLHEQTEKETPGQATYAVPRLISAVRIFLGSAESAPKPEK